MPLHALADLSNASQVSSAGLANDAVTYAKMQNVSNETKLIGRGQGAFGGDPEEITLGFGLAMTATALSVVSAEAATVSTLAKRDGVGGLTAAAFTGINYTVTGTTDYGNSATWTYGTGRAFLHAKSLVPAYLAPQTLTSSASISGVFTSGSQMDLTLAHAATLTLSAVDDGGQGTVRIVIGGTGGYTLALAHSGLTMRQMGQPLSDIGGLATGQWAIIAYERAGSNLHHWVTTL